MGGKKLTLADCGRVTQQGRAALALCCALLVALVLGGLTACSAGDDQVFVDGLNSDMYAIKHGDTDTAMAYFGFDPAATFATNGISAPDAASQLFKNLAVQVDSVRVSESEAAVDATVTANDYAAGLANYQATVTQYLQENDTMPDASTADLQAQAARLYLASIASDDVAPVTRDVTLRYTLDGTTWVLQNREDFASAVFGSAFDELGAGGVQVDTGVGATNPPSAASLASTSGSDGTSQGSRNSRDSQDSQDNDDDDDE